MIWCSSTSAAADDWEILPVLHLSLQTLYCSGTGSTPLQRARISLSPWKARSRDKQVLVILPWQHLTHIIDRPLSENQHNKLPHNKRHTRSNALVRMQTGLCWSGVSTFRLKIAYTLHDKATAYTRMAYMHSSSNQPNTVAVTAGASKTVK